jgi:hypothetical protein
MAEDIQACLERSRHDLSKYHIHFVQSLLVAEILTLWYRYSNIHLPPFGFVKIFPPYFEPKYLYNWKKVRKNIITFYEVTS